MTTANNTLKCRFCPWRTPRFQGKKTGYERLDTHVMLTHYEEFIALHNCRDMDDYLARYDSAGYGAIGDLYP